MKGIEKGVSINLKEGERKKFSGVAFY